MLKKDVLEHYKGPSATARALSIRHSSVCGWGKIIPELQARRLAEITNGALPFDPSHYRDEAPARPALQKREAKA